MGDILRLVTPPTERAVSLSEARRHLRLETTENDDLLDAYLQAAEQSLAFVGRALKPATYALDAYSWRGRWLELPMPPLRGVTSVSTRDSAGTLTALSSSVYSVTTTSEGRGKIIFPAGWQNIAGAWTWGQVNASIVFTAGYDVVPAALRAAILLTTASLFDNRADVAPINIYSVPGVDRLVTPFLEMQA